jgi:hypothetical protein
MRTSFYLVLVLMIMASCREIIDLNLRDQSGRVVIEAVLTDQPGEHFVKVSKSVSFFETNVPNVVTDAVVVLLDAQGNQLAVFEYDEELTYYKTTPNLLLETGPAYQLRVQVDGEWYEASGRIIENGSLDTLYYRFMPALFFREEGYYVYVDGRIPRDELRFFRWMVYVNDTLKNNRTDYFVFDNSLIRDTIRGFELPYAFRIEDRIQLEMYTLNREMFDYYNELISLLFNDGGVFSPPPVNPTTNIVNVSNPDNYPLGFVQFSSLVREFVTIQGE